MRLCYLACLAIAGSACAVAAQPEPGDAVITVNGFCAGHGHAGRREALPDPGDDCKTVITRAQFDQLTEALQPGMPPELRLKVANAYAQMMRMAAAAEQRGLDKTASFDLEMRYARLQLLSQDLGRALRTDADDVTDAQIKDYYDKNRSSFEQVTLARIFVPRTGRTVTVASEEKMERVATDLRARAVQGEDPDRLQAEAYAAAGIPGAAPNTLMADIRRTALPPSHEMVLDLRPGQVGEVLSDPAGGHFVYKMISRRTLSLQDAQAEIHKLIADQRYGDAMKPFSGDVVFNDAYFAAEVTPHRHTHRSTGH